MLLTESRIKVSLIGIGEKYDGKGCIWVEF